MIHRLQILARCLLPAVIRKPLADQVYGLLTRAMNFKQKLRLRLQTLWRKAASRPGMGRIAKPVQCRVLELTQRLGINYASHLEKFGQALPDLALRGDEHSGVAMMIGTLGGGGSERQLVLTAQGLQARGITNLAVTVASLQDEADRFFLPDLTHAGVRAVAFNDLDRKQELPAHAVTALNKLPRKLIRMRAYLRALAQQRPEVAHLWLDDVNVKGGLAAAALGVRRIVLGMRSLPPTNFLLYQPYMRDCYRWLARQPGVVMVNNSQAGAYAYEQWLGLARGSITVLRNGFVFDDALLHSSREQRSNLRERLGISPGAPVVGSAMRLSEEKRPGLWLETATRLTDLLPDAHYIVAGDGPMFKALQRKAKNIGMGGRIHWLGRTKEVFAAMAAMDLFLLTSRVEGLPNVLVEAQSLGVPVVSTNAGGAPETMQHGVTGWILERDDPRYIALELKRLWDDQDWRRRAQTEGLPWVRRRFGLERMIDETLAVYQLDRRQIGGEAPQENFHDSHRRSTK